MSNDARKPTDSERLKAACANLETSLAAAKARQEARFAWDRIMSRINNAAHGVHIVSVGDSDATPAIDDEEAGDEA